MFRVCHAILSSIYCSLVVTCWERADLLALLYVMFYCVLSLSNGVAWVNCGTWVYRFLIFASFLTLRNESKIILCFKRWPKNCCLAHMRRKFFNMAWRAKPAMPPSILVEGYCKNVHTRMHAHTHECTYETHVHAPKCSYTSACIHTHTYVCMHAHTSKHLYIYILTWKSKLALLRYRIQRIGCVAWQDRSQKKENLSKLFSPRRFVLEKLINHKT